MEVILSAKHLNKTYDMGEVKVEAVKDISLEIEKGYFYAIIGKSGSGKSTLLHLLSGFDKPTKGSVYMGGEDIHKMKDAKLSAMRREKMGFVFQSYNLLPEFCVEENISIPLYLNHSKPKEGYIQELMKALGIYELRLKFLSQLSGGEQQRVAIARALVAQPDIVFADEPTGNLDQQSGRGVLELLKMMKEKWGQTLLLVTHDMEIAQNADRIIEIQDGVIVRKGA
jgi:putative ABC transport system ATP-binding protein